MSREREREKEREREREREGGGYCCVLKNVRVSCHLQGHKNLVDGIKPFDVIAIYNYSTPQPGDLALAKVSMNRGSLMSTKLTSVVSKSDGVCMRKWLCDVCTYVVTTVCVVGLLLVAAVH